MTYDVIVVGIGGMGSAAVYHLARRGVKLLGLEQFDILHERGSSHGISRIIRLAYAEHPDYVPLLRRAYQLWRELETIVDERLLYVTGGIDAGYEESGTVKVFAEGWPPPHLTVVFQDIALRMIWSASISRTPVSFYPSAAWLRMS